jgi:hypothetical protein
MLFGGIIPAYAVTRWEHPTVIIPQGTVNLHPGPRGENSVIQWTAPAAGTYTIQGWFTGNDFRYPTTTDVAIMHGTRPNENEVVTTAIFTGAIDSYNEPLYFSLSKQPLKAGETIDFAVGYGSNETYIGDSTGISATISLIPLPVAIDIKPGEDPNCVNIDGNGVIPVAILGSADFDVTDIDVASLKFAGLDVRVKGNRLPQCALEDVSGDFASPEGAPDRYLDLVCQFVDDPDRWSPDEGTAKLTGKLLDGMPIEGTDAICIVP